MPARNLGIGGDYCFPWSDLCRHRRNDSERLYPSGHSLWVSSGRAGLEVVARCARLGPGDEVLLPAYLCQSVLDPFLRRGCRLAFYRLDSHLNADPGSLRDSVTSQTRLVLVIHYFGFPQPDTVLETLHSERTRRGLDFILAEDLTHASLSSWLGLPLGMAADYTVASFRKLFPVPDGALVTRRAGPFPEEALISGKHSLFSLRKTIGLVARDFSGRFGWPSKDWALSILRRAESWLDSKWTLEPASLLSRRILTSCNYAGIVTARRQNFRLLLAATQGLTTMRPFFTKLPDRVCPLGFPLLCEHREQLKRYLIANEVYPPIHWALPSIIGQQEYPDSWTTSRTILTIPIDQRYHKADMEGVVSLLRGFSL